MKRQVGCRDKGSSPLSERPLDSRSYCSTALTTGDGQALVLLMLCGRTQAISEDVSREQVRANLQNQRLASYANGYLAELKADAVISYP